MYEEIKKQDFAYVIKVGANNGLTDPLFNEYCRPGWGGILVEPVPHIFVELMANVSNNKFKLLLGAISDTEIAKEFYFLDGDISFLPGWSSQIGSFERDHITKHFDGDVLKKVESIIRYFYVPSITLDSLVNLAEQEIDLLAIDCESYDYKILKSFSFKVSPKFIVYEHNHMTLEQQLDLSSYLDQKGYVSTFKDQFNSEFKLR